MEETNLFKVKNNSNNNTTTVSGATKDFFRTSWTVAKFLNWNDLLGKTCKEIKEALSEYPDVLKCFEDCSLHCEYSDTDVVPVCKIDYYIDLLYEADCCNNIEEIIKLFYSGGVDDSSLFRLDTYVRTEHFNVNTMLKDFLSSATFYLDGRSFVTFRKLYEALCKKFSIHTNCIDEKLQGDVYARSVSTDSNGNITTKCKIRADLISELKEIYVTLPNEFNDGTYTYVKQSIFSSVEEYRRDTDYNYNTDLFICNEVTRLYSGYKVCINEFKFSILNLSKNDFNKLVPGHVEILRPCKYRDLGDLCSSIFNKEDYSNGIMTILLGLDNSESTDVIYDCIPEKDRVGLSSFDSLVTTLRDFKLSLLTFIIYQRMFAKGEYTSLQDIDTLLRLQVELSNPKVSEKEYTKLHSMYFNQLKEIEDKYKTKSDLVINTCILTYVNVYYNSETKWWGDFMDDLVATLFR